MSGPHVLNRHHYRGREFPPGSFYVGRSGQLARQILAEHPELGDLTALGNPFRHEEHGEAALDLYRRWLFEAIRRRDNGVLSALEEITAESSLVCSCVRKDGGGKCHAGVIAAAWRWWSSEGKTSPATRRRGRGVGGDGAAERHRAPGGGGGGHDPRGGRRVPGVAVSVVEAGD